MISAPPNAPIAPTPLGQLAQVAGDSLLIDNSDTSWLKSPWWLQLQPGSWRGLVFYTDTAETTTGRRTAVHEYPYRDTVWVEDLGRLPRRFRFRAWLTGDDVYQQRDAMIVACETPGEGTLVHPTLGAVQCVLVGFQVVDRKERGRYVEVNFDFLVTGNITLPAAAKATGAAVINEAAALITALATDLTLEMQQQQVSRVEQVVADSLTGFPDTAVDAVNDPARALNATVGLPGYNGRYASGNRSTLQDPSATVETALNNAVLTRAAVLTASSNMVAALEALT